VELHCCLSIRYPAPDDPAGIIPADGAIDLEFSVFEPRSPAELGASSDERLLGIGIETLSFR
jgi:hypothetical protein